MGPTGPCGPCTEIHYDFLGRSNAAEWVNAGHPDVIELWNLVFIQFERCEDGSLVPLPSFHVDTGMGLERLASVLQGVTSTYDTDIFQPLFSLIHKSTSAPQYCGKFGLEDTEGLDTGYRILADHSRMITVAIADGMLPDHNHRLRRVIRRALSVSKDLFSRKERAHELLFDLCTVVADSLEGPYPGLISRLDCIKAVLSHENLMLSKLQSDSANKWNEILLERPELAHIDIKSSPGILKVLKELEVSSNRGMQEIDDEKAFVLYDTYGLNEAAIRELGTAFDLDFDSEGFHRKLKEARDKSRKSGNFNSLEEMVPSKAIIELCARGVTPTKDDLKYHYSRDSLGRYQFAAVEAVIQAIIYKGKVVSHVEAEIQEQEDFGVVLDQTCFYHESGGQVADTGFIIPLNGNGQKMFVKDVQASGGYVVHWGTVMKDQNGSLLSENSPQFQVGKTVKLIINEENRLKIMRNHTAVHCLGAALRHSAPATAQRSSLVTPTHFSYQFSVYGIQEARPATGNKLSKQKSETVSDANDFSWQKFLESAEKKVRTVVSGKEAPVRRKTLTSIQLLHEMSRASNKLEEIATVPGEVYPESGVHLVEVMVSSSSGVLDNLAEIKVEDTKGNDNLLMWSREPCCGTHVLDATDILDFCLVDVESAGSTSRIVKAVTGNNAISAKARGEQFLLKIKDLERRVNEFLKNAPDDKDSERRVSAQYLVDTFENELKSLKTSQGMSDQSLADSIPFIDRCHSMELISTLESSLKEYKKGIDHLRIEQEILSAVESLNGLRYLVHCIHPGHSQSDKVLQMATKFCPKDLPVLVFAAVNDGKAVKARCVVPKELATDVFNAEKWITPVMKIFKGVGSAPKGQDPRYIFNMREKKFPTDSTKEESARKFERARKVAQDFAAKAFLN
ncbi:alanine--tRNA ligase, mitochondrial isoform X2 [Ischnura elegans]|nr:alanine--tRNA ligase, mitochondrial isoform X2 [Ischnura elegans]